MTIVYHGRTATLAAVWESAYRTAPGSPASQLLKFSTLEIGRDTDLQDDPTINTDPLMEKRDEMDSTASAALNAILCLNDIGWHLKGLLGAPVTTGSGPTYTHTFTLDLADRPSQIYELSLGTGGDLRYERYIGMMLNELNWAAMDANQSITANLIGAVEVRPAPTTPIDASPAALYTKQRACTRRANIYDVFGASTLGDISTCSISFKSDLEGQKLADANEGFGRVLLGQPSVSGSLSGLLEPGTLYDYARARTSKKLVIAQANAAGDHTMVTTIPNVEFDVPKMNIKSSKGQVVENLGWRAHKVAGANPVTVVLTNSTASYA